MVRQYLARVLTAGFGRRGRDGSNGRVSHVSVSRAPGQSPSGNSREGSEGDGAVAVPVFERRNPAAKSHEQVMADLMHDVKELQGILNDEINAMLRKAGSVE